MEKINVNRKIVTKVNTFQVTNDVIVPDIKPDIVNIITVNGIAYIYRQEIENSRIKLDGNIDSFIIYLSGDGDTRSIQTTLSFNNSLEDNKVKENSVLKSNVRISNIESKVLNERKLSIVATVSVEYVVSEVQEIGISDEFLNNIPLLQKQEKELNIKSLVGCNTSKATLKEDINIEDEIAEVLKVDINITNGEEKISYNKVLTKGESEISIIYLTEEGRINVAKASFPIMSFVDIDNVTEGNTCKTTYSIRNMLFKLNNRESHSVTFQIDFEILCEAFENKNINIVSDLYSLSNDVEISYKNVCLENISEDDEMLEIDEKVKLEDIKNLLAVENNGVQVIKNDNYNIEGEINLKIYYEVTNKSGLNVKKVKIPFITKVKAQSNIRFEVANISNSVISDELRLNIRLNMLTIESNSNNINFIENVNVLKPNEDDDYNVVVYLVKRNDDLWHIAKKFKVTTESIVKVNNLENPDMIYPGDKLYILK